MKKFTVLFPNGKAINQNTLINGFKITDELHLCKTIKQAWCKWSGSKNFTEWAKEGNEDDNHEGTFTVENALDNLCNNFHLQIDGQAINLYRFFQQYLPLKTEIK